MIDLHEHLMALPRRVKRLMVLGLDTLLVPAALGLAVLLRQGPGGWDEIPEVALAGLLVAQPAIWLGVGVQRLKLRGQDMPAVGRLGLLSGCLGIATGALLGLAGSDLPYSIAGIFTAAYFAMILAGRGAALQFLSVLRDGGRGRKPVLIYGAGYEGVQIASALRMSDILRPVGFIDDNAALQGLEIAGLRVRPPSDLPRFAERRGVTRVILAIPDLCASRREEIVASLHEIGIEVEFLPSHAALLDRGAIDRKLRPVGPDELLGRDKVDLDVPAVAKAYAGRVVMVTGAGGSIGSELCRQLLDCRPRRIVLFDHGEFALYQIDRSLRALCPEGANIDICTRLGSVTDSVRVRDVIETDSVEFVLHTAAYKHVPLVEENELEGARNNVLGTRIMAEAAIAAGVERFILVSTDKAVRPTNIMGASKRLAELVVQDLQTRTTGTRLAMVRFGNVLGSSGSVLPLFQSQIEQGGPVTVTHPAVTRFFMTIPEAARLVLLAGAYAEGKDVFVLDMGEPVKIMDIARRMIALSGQRVRSSAHPEGIAIEITGLRPGEKLYEELLIDNDTLVATPHAKILRAEEESLSQIETAAMLREVGAAIDAGDPNRLRVIVQRYVRGYCAPQSIPANLPVPVAISATGGRP